MACGHHCSSVAFPEDLDRNTESDSRACVGGTDYRRRNYDPAGHAGLEIPRPSHDAPGDRCRADADFGIADPSIWRTRGDALSRIRVAGFSGVLPGFAST